MKKASLLYILFFGFLMNAQTISGTILSKEENQPIPYAKIGIDNQNTGTIADENGNFKIDLTNIDKKKNLQIEVGGFEKFTISVDQSLKENNHKIFLTEKVKDIEEIKINPEKFVIENWGVNSKTKRRRFGHIASKDGTDQSREIAVLFKTDKKIKIEKIKINIVTFKADRPVFVRFNIYDKNLNSILEEDLYDEITRDKIIKNSYSFDVSENQIWLNDDFYVGIQLLNYFEGSLYMSGALNGNKTIFRNFLSGWINVPTISPAINIDVKVQK